MRHRLRVRVRSRGIVRVKISVPETRSNCVLESPGFRVPASQPEREPESESESEAEAEAMLWVQFQFGGWGEL